MRVLIIGGTGLISSAITQELITRGDEVVHYNRGRLDLYPNPPGVTTVHGDRTDYAAFERQMAELGMFDCVMDMVGYQPDDAVSAVRAFRGRVGHFIFCSTVDVYRKPASRYPYTEAEAYGGLNAYSRNKVSQEKTLWAAHDPTDFPLTIIRPAYTYGEGRGPLHTFGWGTVYVDRIRKGKPIVAHGDGNSFWVSCHRDDVGRAFAYAAGQPHTFGKAYHTTGEEWLTWNQYHEQVAQAIDAPRPTLVHIPSDALARLVPQHAELAVTNLQHNNIFDNSAARADLAFKYTVSWKEGARRMVTWLDAHNKVADSDADPFEDQLIERWRRMIESSA